MRHHGVIKVAKPESPFPTTNGEDLKDRLYS
jgi:hypothetical protein